MKKTLDIELNNGKNGDALETVSIRCVKQDDGWGCCVILENNARTFRKSTNGESSEIDSNDTTLWWYVTAVDTIRDIIENQTAVDDVDEYLEGEGQWMVDIPVGFFEDDKWINKAN